MSVYKPRTRTVSFRISEEEYTGLTSLCIARGSRSISDLARAAVRQIIADGEVSAYDSLDARVRELGGKAEQIDREVKRLAQLVEPTA